MHQTSSALPGAVPKSATGEKRNCLACADCLPATELECGSAGDIVNVVVGPDLTTRNRARGWACGRWWVDGNIQSIELAGSRRCGRSAKRGCSSSVDPLEIDRPTDE
jgi:hypothetical protein